MAPAGLRATGAASDGTLGEALPVQFYGFKPGRGGHADTPQFR
jgi:hypothetical protein